MKLALALVPLSLALAGCNDHAKAAGAMSVVLYPAALAERAVTPAEPAQALVTAVQKSDSAQLEKLLIAHPDWLARRGPAAYELARTRGDEKCLEVLRRHGYHVPPTRPPAVPAPEPAPTPATSTTPAPPRL